MPRKSSRQKPAKPRPDFPLTANSNGQWSKKIKQKVHYFGPWANPDAALNLWLEQKDDLLAGRKPRANRDELSVEELLNQYLHAKKQQVDEGAITPRHWQDMKRACEHAIVTFGRTRAVSDLRADDFVTLRARLAKTLGVSAIGNTVQRIRSAFKYAYDAELIPAPVRFGPTFKRPSKKQRRAVRRAAGEKLFTAAEVRALLAVANVPMKAAILLGINCAFGQSDLATLPQSRLDLSKGWHNYERPKTGEDRRCKLWPETIEALQAVLAKRPTPKDSVDADLVFITKFGERWVRTANEGKTWIDGITQEFKKLLKACNNERQGASFYDLRRTFRTMADELRDEAAIMLVMGHSAGDDDMGATYRQRIDDARLSSIADHLHNWLFSEVTMPVSTK